jgi:hypothetical protein
MRIAVKRMCGAAAALAVACMASAVTAHPPSVSKAPQQVGELEDVVTMRLEGSVVVDPAGKVVSHTLDTKLDENLAGLVRKAVAAWTFSPPVIDGSPATVRSRMWITLAGREVASGYEVRIDNVNFYNPPDPKNAAAPDKPRIQLTSIKPSPKYPKYNVNGGITLLVRFSPDGAVADVVATQCSLYFAGGRATDKVAACRAMISNATTAVRKWRATVPAELAREPGGLTGTLPFQYIGLQGAELVAASGEPGQWRRESRTRYAEPAWRDAGTQRVGSSDVADGALRMASTPLRLNAGAIGKVL